MNKTKLFLHLYREKTTQNITLFLLFSLLAAVISIVLFVQANNKLLIQNGGLEAFGALTENMLGLIAVAAIFIGAAGSIFLIGFRNQAAEKSLVIMHIFGLSKRDLLWKAFIDSVIYALLASCVGYFTGYSIFFKFVRKRLHTDVELGIFSAQTAATLIKTLVLILFVVFMGNLFIDFRMFEKPVVDILYARKGKKGKQQSSRLLVGIVTGIMVYALVIFRIKGNNLVIIGAVVLLISSILFFFFHIFFGCITKKHRQSHKIKSAVDLSFCFLCSRNKRDALLAIVISVGTLIVCIMANIWFNIGGMLRSAYRDNMGYSTLVRVTDFGQKGEVQQRLDTEGILYTYGYSKLMDYAELRGMGGTDGKFWAFVIAGNTDSNPHFQVAEHSFLTENLFASKCGFEIGESTAVFGKDVDCVGWLTDKQYLASMNYNFIINQSDWGLGIDDSWHVVFLVDASLSEERMIEEQMQDMSCKVETASKLIDEIQSMLSDYFDVIILVAAMIILVTAAIFYTVIQSDLTTRRTELYLYRIFGASFHKAQRIIYGEYIMIALAASFAASFSIMISGELYFYYGIGKHFWLSIPMVGVTVGAAVIFVCRCFLAAVDINAKNAGLEVIRDE